MNPFHLSASELLIWGIVIHLVADWLFQSGWMVENKTKRMERADRWDTEGTGEIMTGTAPPSRWYLRHPAAYAHAGIHGVLLAIVFGWPAIFLAWAHLIIDTRVPVLWWTKTFGQTQPWGDTVEVATKPMSTVEHTISAIMGLDPPRKKVPLYDIGTEVQIWVDQVFHIVCIAAMALLVHI